MDTYPISTGPWSGPSLCHLKWPNWVQCHNSRYSYNTTIISEKIACKGIKALSSRDPLRVEWTNVHTNSLKSTQLHVSVASELPRIPVSRLSPLDSGALAAVIPSDLSNRYSHPCQISLFSYDFLLWNQQRESSRWEGSAAKGRNLHVSEDRIVCHTLLELAWSALCTPPFRLAGTHLGDIDAPSACTPLWSLANLQTQPDLLL